MSNYQDVLAQLQSFGLLVDDLRVGEARPVRCKVEGDREKRGWYILHELRTQDGEELIVGSYGMWRGNEQHTQKVEIRRADAFSAEQRDALKRRLAEDRKRAEVARKRDAAAAAAKAEAMWLRLATTGESDYLDRKSVQGHGLRYTPNGSAVVPVLDSGGRIHGLQFLRTAAQAEKAHRPVKEFWPAGLIKKGHFHLIGTPEHVLLIAEGYATAASLREATGYPVAVAFDAGNLEPVAAALRWRYKRTRILICGDDDGLAKCHHCKRRLVLALDAKVCPSCGQDHGAGNAGITGASTAALAVSGAWMVPRFADEDGRRAAYLATGAKPTDFNDLHVAEGQHVVRTQVEARLSELGWHHVSVAPASPSGGEGPEKLKPLESTLDLLKRYSLVYAHSGAVFDRQEHILLSLSDMRDACVRKDIHRSWAESPHRDIVRIREVGFDPTMSDPSISCNLYGGWPTKPVAGKCERLLELLEFMCRGDASSGALAKWVLRWIAWPIQNPGAKMKTTLVLHGPQGTGKNLFFEALMSIYGEYGDVIDQSAVEDKFNDWASRKLFMIADEVVARSDLYHVKNKLKALITGDRIRINPKNFQAYWERNHLNLVFLSNENMPVVLEEDDRRHCVIWTPPPLDQAFYSAVIDEIRDGGVAALHDYLLNVPMGDFNASSKPPVTGAKVELIALGLDSPQRFYDDVLSGNVPGLVAMPALTLDWFEAYGHWCRRTNQRPAPMPKFVNALERKRNILSARKRYIPGASEKGPHAFLFMGEARVPEGVDEKLWLGNCHTEFTSYLEEYRAVKK